MSRTDMYLQYVVGLPLTLLVFIQVLDSAQLSTLIVIRLRVLYLLVF